MRRYLVTGGLGFIGSHVASLLLDDPDAHVTVVDNLMNHAFPAQAVADEIKAGKSGTLECVIKSIADYHPTTEFERIFHLASVVGPAAVLGHAGHITENIVRDTYHVIRLAQQHDALLVNVSTSEVYGGGDRGFCSEDHPRVLRGSASARQEYASAKSASEVAIENLCSTGQLKAVNIRPFNVSGVRQLGRGGFVLPRFVGQALLGLPLTVFGDGSQVRAFTDARDVASGIVMASEKGAIGRVYNVGNPQNRITILSLAEAVLDVTGAIGGIELTDPKSIYGEHYQEAADKFPEASRLADLGWIPRYRIQDTIADVYQWLASLPVPVMKRAAGLESQALSTSMLLAPGL